MLSIVIITKNEERCLPRLLDSIKGQDFHGNFEIIVSDANSTDMTREIALSYGCKIIDGGLPSVGRNNGAKIAQYPILLFLDADTQLPRGFISSLLFEMKRKGADCGTVKYSPLSAKWIDNLLYSCYNYLVMILQHFYPLSGGTCLFCTKSLWEQVGGFDESLSMAEDHNFVNKCGKIAKFRFISKVKIFCDVRRLEKEGRWGLLVKYGKVAIKYIFSGTKVEDLQFDYKLQGDVNVGKKNG